MIATRAIPFFAKERAMSKGSFHASTLSARLAIGLASVVLLGVSYVLVGVDAQQDRIARMSPPRLRSVSFHPLPVAGHGV